ncbi:MAG: hypothetical protein U5K76_02835 [Woeseiaceae bacterium]|nr:hypothetical protein [Woeseiaceae bacterium]
MAVIAVIDLRERARAAGVDQVVVGALQQAVAVGLAKGPGDRVVQLEVERDTQVRVEMTLDVERRAVRDRQVDLAQGDLLQQVTDLEIGVLGPLDLRVHGGKRRHHVRMAAVRGDFDGTPDDALDIARPAGAEAVDQVHVDGAAEGSR